MNFVEVLRSWGKAGDRPLRGESSLSWGALDFPSDNLLCWSERPGSAKSSLSIRPANRPNFSVSRPRQPTIFIVFVTSPR